MSEPKTMTSLSLRTYACQTCGKQSLGGAVGRDGVQVAWMSPEGPCAHCGAEFPQTRDPLPGTDA